MLSSNEEDGKVVDGGLLGDANGVEAGGGRHKESGKWQRPRFTRKALMRCCLVKWIIASAGPKEQASVVLVMKIISNGLFSSSHLGAELLE
ncbi:hypothetical protein DNTS_000470 [Danionella cerebrum]|uniref:Uncharacterized protein n=1 Tax=Danionella cerebrum TaxID=2873325 RepID=A0A553P9C8_9TELE|nr:hypothetical protein DNTS_000470 [Danionella translucida]